MPLIFTVVSWLPIPLVEQVTGPRVTTVNIALIVVGNYNIFACFFGGPYEVTITGIAPYRSIPKFSPKNMGG